MVKQTNRQRTKGLEWPFFLWPFLGPYVSACFRPFSFWAILLFPDYFGPYTAAYRPLEIGVYLWAFVPCHGRTWL